MTKALLFYLFSGVMLFATLRVVTARNPVHAVLYLILAFAQAAGVWLLLEAEFLAIALALVYLGAVAALFLLVIMTFDIRIERAKSDFFRHFSTAALVGVLLAAEMVAVIISSFRVADAPPLAATIETASGQLVPYSNTRALGILLYTEYLYPVTIAAVLLLMAMIAAIALTLRQRKDRKIVLPSTQVGVKASGRLKVLKMEPVGRAELPQESGNATQGAQK